MMKSPIDLDKPDAAGMALPENIRYRLDIVFASAALTLLAGVLIPIPVRFLDMAWIGAICLAAAIVFICAIAKSCHDLQGFGLLAAALILLRICLTAMTIRKILVERATSIVLDILGKSVQGIGVIAAVIIVLLVVIAGFGSLFGAANWIGRAISNYGGQILPVKRASLQAELSLKRIPHEQARQVLEKIRSEMRFYGSMAAVAMLMRCEAVAGLAMIVAALTIKVFTDALSAGYNAELMNTLASNAAGLAIVAVLPAVAAGWACAVLLRKESLCLMAVEPAAEEKTQKIKLASSSAESVREVELLNPDFVSRAASAGQTEEKIVEFEKEKMTKPVETEYPITRLRRESMEQYYEELTGVIQSIPIKKGQGVLLATPSEITLGIQIAVNVAIRLAGAGLKILLIDLEPGRNAAAKAFELDTSKTLGGPQKTCIDNLQVFTAGTTETQAIGRTILAMDKLQEHFDRILIYAPQRMQLAAGKSAQRFHAVVFVNPPDSSDVIRLSNASRQFASVTVLPGPDSAVSRSS